jgi:hypothetical protein
MIVIVGVVILIAAVIVSVIGVLSNSGSGHPLPHDFPVLDYHVTGSTGTPFLYGLAVGATALVGLSLLEAGARPTSRRGRDARCGPGQPWRETAAVTRDRGEVSATVTPGHASARSLDRALSPARPCPPTARGQHRPPARRRP